MELEERSSNHQGHSYVCLLIICMKVNVSPIVARHCKKKKEKKSTTIKEKSGDQHSQIHPLGTMDVYKMSYQSTQDLLRYFSLDQSGGPTDQQCDICHPIIWEQDS